MGRSVKCELSPKDTNWWTKNNIMDIDGEIAKLIAI